MATPVPSPSNTTKTRVILTPEKQKRTIEIDGRKYIVTYEVAGKEKDIGAKGAKELENRIQKLYEKLNEKTRTAFEKTKAKEGNIELRFESHKLQDITFKKTRGSSSLTKKVDEIRDSKIGRIAFKTAVGRLNAAEKALSDRSTSSTSSRPSSPSSSSRSEDDGDDEGSEKPPINTTKVSPKPQATLSSSLPSSSDDEEEEPSDPSHFKTPPSTPHSKTEPKKKSFSDIESDPFETPIKIVEETVEPKKESEQFGTPTTTTPPKSKEPSSFDKFFGKHSTSSEPEDFSFSTTDDVIPSPQPAQPPLKKVHRKTKAKRRPAAVQTSAPPGHASQKTAKDALRTFFKFATSKAMDRTEMIPKRITYLKGNSELGSLKAYQALSLALYYEYTGASKESIDMISFYTTKKKAAEGYLDKAFLTEDSTVAAIMITKYFTEANKNEDTQKRLNNIEKNTYFFLNLIENPPK